MSDEEPDSKDSLYAGFCACLLAVLVWMLVMGILIAVLSGLRN